MTGREEMMPGGRHLKPKRFLQGEVSPGKDEEDNCEEMGRGAPMFTKDKDQHEVSRCMQGGRGV